MKYAVIGAVVLVAGPAQALIECIYYDQMVAAAVSVVQMESPKVGAADAQGNCALSGHIARVFGGTLQVDTWLETAVPCENSQDIAGPAIYTGSEALMGSKVIELHLDQAGQITGYGAGVVLLDALTESPMWKPLCGE